MPARLNFLYKFRANSILYVPPYVDYYSNEGVRMRTILIACLLTVIAASAPAIGADLYHVTVTNADIADRLNETGVEPVTVVQGGYLVLADPVDYSRLEAAGIRMDLIATGVAKDDLALDLRLDDQNKSRYDLLFEENGLRLYRVDAGSAVKAFADQSLMPIRNDFLKIVYRPQKEFDKSSLAHIDDLQGLIDQVIQDSLQSYTEALQAFGNRYSGTTSSDLSRDWLADKFVEFGYDSILIDSFVATVGGSPTQCQNVLAVKVGTARPDLYVVVGGHRDAVSSSPGADDNGSGSAAVLEIARILKDIPTDLTFIFALFGAEEQGLYGSSHYAGEAAARGDSIVYMLNMDMIAHFENSSNAKLYYGTMTTYTLLLQDLADSLVGITAVLSGSSGGSDHYPFIQNGYEATFLHEYIFSTVYHSYRDSTSYMSFPYMTKMVKAALATAYTVSETYIPGPELRFDYPDGVPATLTPGEPSTFRVSVVGINEGVPVPGSGRMYFSVNGGNFVEEAMTETSPDLYQAELPGLACGETIQFYFGAEEVDSGYFYNPGPAEPFSATPVTGESTAFYDDFEQDLGWTISGGQWQRGSPTGGGGAYGGPDPVGGYESPTCFGYNLAGDYANNMPQYHLTSPAIDCSDLSSVRVRFMRWLGVEQPRYDHAYVSVSNDGASWTTVWQNPVEITDYVWTQQEYDISDVADGQSTVYVRFTMGTTDVMWTFCGWNIDNVEVFGNNCESGPTTLQIITESVPDWTANHPYSQQLIATGGVGVRSWSDKNGDLTGTGLSLSTTGVLAGTPVSAGQIAFTALVADEESGSDEQPLTFTVNPALEITSDPVYSTPVGQPYSMQLTCTGGTGTLSWSDKNGDLEGTGLALSETGLLSGTPIDVGTISCTARVQDAVGSADDMPVTIDVLAPYQCGDASGDGEIDISDAVYLITYIFKSGPAPDPLCAGDIDNIDAVDIADAVYLINYIFKSGPPPDEGCCP